MTGTSGPEERKREKKETAEETIARLKKSAVGGEGKVAGKSGAGKKSAEAAESGKAGEAKTEAVGAAVAVEVVEVVDGEAPKVRGADAWIKRTEEPKASTLKKKEAAAKAKALSKKEKKQQQAKLWPTPPPKLMREMGRCMAEWNMIPKGSRLLLGLSGGKDSLVLLHMLHAHRKKWPHYELAAATVDPFNGTKNQAFDPSPMIPYLAQLGIDYHFLDEPIFDRATVEMEKKKKGFSVCSYCSRMKRGALYTCARKHGYTHLVLAQHLDDLAETFIMNAFHGGTAGTMKAKYINDTGEICIIRPLAYSREADLRQFAGDAALPVISENCPACFEGPRERKRVKKMLSTEESQVPHLFGNLRKMLKPLMDEEVHELFNAVQDRCESRSSRNKRNPQQKKKRGQPVGGRRRGEAARKNELRQLADVKNAASGREETKAAGGGGRRRRTR